MFLGRERIKPGFVGKLFRTLDRSGMNKFAREKLTELGLMTIQNIEQPVESLSGGQRQGVAVALPLLCRQLFHEAALHKIRVAAWTVRTERDVARLGSESLYAVCGEGEGLSKMLVSR